VSERKRRMPRLGIVAVAAVVLSGFGYLIYGGIGENLVYFLTPDELLERGSTAYDSPVRLGGMVVPGSVTWDADAIDLRFAMVGEEDGERHVAVHSRKAPPQMFREGMGVVVEGRLRPGGVFEASNLMVMHSNEYRAPDHGEKPADMYRSLLPDGE
jgi:cytochrome c-type biogenesis protein CcmE